MTDSQINALIEEKNSVVRTNWKLLDWQGRAAGMLRNLSEIGTGVLGDPVCPVCGKGIGFHSLGCELDKLLSEVKP